MKSFAELREATKVNRGMSPGKPLQGEIVFKKKMGKYPVAINKDKDGFHTYIDGDLLDTFRSQADAMKAIKTTLKALQ